MFQFHPYFTLNARKGLRGLLTDKHGEVIFRKLRAERAFKLWKDGAAYLHITKEGARHFMGEATEQERIKFLEACKTGPEVEAVLKVSTAHAALKNAAKERLAELGLEPAEEATTPSASTKEARPSTRKKRS